MLIIRKVQLDRFALERRLSFEQEMACYLRRHFPFEAAHADLEAWVRLGLASAGDAGFAGRAESAQYLALVAMLGVGFDADPMLPWVEQTLAGPAPAQQRMDRMFDRSLDFLDAIGGRKCAWLIRAKLRVRRQDTTVLDSGVRARRLTRELADVLRAIYPQKADAVGEVAMKKLVESAIECARSRGALRHQSALIQALHAFMLGCGFAADPLYPWTMASLAEPAIDPDDCYVRMHRHSLEYLDRSFAVTASRS